MCCIGLMGLPPSIWRNCLKNFKCDIFPFVSFRFWAFVLRTEYLTVDESNTHQMHTSSKLITKRLLRYCGVDVNL